VGPVQLVNDEIVPEKVIAPFTLSVNVLFAGAVVGKIEHPGKCVRLRPELGTTIVTLVAGGPFGSTARSVNAPLVVVIVNGSHCEFCADWTVPIPILYTTPWLNPVFWKLNTPFVDVRD
jgi:hypothetical protein